MPAHVYKKNLEKMIDDVHSVGAEIVISTPIREASSLQTTDRMNEILKAARQAAADKNVTFLDIYGRTDAENPNPEDIQKKYTMHVDTLKASSEDGGFDFADAEVWGHGNVYIKAGNDDHIHINIRGANYYSRLMTLELLESNSELRKYVRYTE